MPCTLLTSSEFLQRNAKNEVNVSAKVQGEVERDLATPTRYAFTAAQVSSIIMIALFYSNCLLEPGSQYHKNASVVSVKPSSEYDISSAKRHDRPKRSKRSIRPKF